MGECRDDQVELLNFCHTLWGPEVIHKRWSGVMNKFAVRNTDLSKFKQLPHVPCGEVWRMTEYSQVALLDTDMVFDVDSESLFLNWFSHFFPGRHVVTNMSVFSSFRFALQAD